MTQFSQVNKLGEPVLVIPNLVRLVLLQHGCCLSNRSCIKVGVEVSHDDSLNGCVGAYRFGCSHLSRDIFDTDTSNSILLIQTGEPCERRGRRTIKTDSHVTRVQSELVTWLLPPNGQFQLICHIR